MRRSKRKLMILGGALALGSLLLVPVAMRLFEIRSATRRTSQFCRSIKQGDEIAAVLERAERGESILAAAAAATHVRPSPRVAQLPRQPVQDGQGFKVVFEDHEGRPTWPRYLIWTGPAYGRVYCGLEPSSQGTVQAIHLGPTDERTPGFFEDWFDGID